MYLILKNHNEEYASREMITAHIPKIKIELTDTIPENGDYVISEVIYSNGKYKYTAALMLDGKKYESCFCAECENKIYVKKTINEVFKSALGTNLPWGLITGIRPSKMVRELSERGMQIPDIKNRFESVYECNTDKTELAIKVAQKEKLLIKTMPENSISLYVGIPFCPTRRLYCSFTSQSIKFSNKLTEPYMDALLKEISSTADIIKERGLNIDTVYIGGGTPTALNEKQLERLLKGVYESFDLSKTREFTLEAGRPDTINAEKLKIIRDYGISHQSPDHESKNSGYHRKMPYTQRNYRYI